MGIISRGFSGRRSAADVKLPPGQYLTTDFPVLSAGPTPHVSLDRWEFVIDDGTNWKHLGAYLSHQRHQSATTGHFQLAEDGVEMFFYRFETQAAFIGNLLIAAPIAH